VALQFSDQGPHQVFELSQSCLTPEALPEAKGHENHNGVAIGQMLIEVAEAILARLQRHLIRRQARLRRTSFARA
jgi:hypothetical protein